MNWLEASTGQWLLHSAIGGGTLLLLANCVMLLVRQPARRQRLGEWAMAAALIVALLSLAPAWLVVSLPRPSTEPIAPAVSVAEATDPAPSEKLPHEPSFSQGAVPMDLADQARAAESIEPSAPSTASTAPPVATSSTSLSELPWLRILGIVYGAGALVILGRWLLGYAALWRMLRTAEPAPLPVARLFEDMTAGPRRPRLLVARRLRVPLSCGLLRPSVVLPAGLREAPVGELRWVFAHELTHLERRDPWTCLLFALGQAVYFYLPWFWSLRRQVQLCQEYVADASAVAEAEQRADYAEFLLSLTTTPMAPAGATGVSGHTSDLFRRIAMLLQNPHALERRCPRLWSLATASGLLSIAVLIAGIGLRADASTPADDNAAKNVDDTKKDEPKKDQPKKAKPKKDDGDKDDAKSEEKEKKRFFGGNFELPDLEEILKNLPQNLDPEKLAEIRKQIQQMRAEMRNRMEEVRKNMPEGGRFGFRGRLFPGQGRLGVRVERPSPVLADQLNLPRDQGLVVEDVTPDSAAAKAGLKPHDILLQFNGKPVPSNAAEFAELLREIKADATVNAVVKRKGKEETIKGLTLPELKTEPKPRRRQGGSIREFVPPMPPAKPGSVFELDIPVDVL
jgi:beta-lactamase regulating signal transducer with metallopeptidase domain